MKAIPVTALALFAALSCFAAACAPARLHVPDGLADTPTAYALDGHSPRRAGQPIRFGPYRASVLREGATFSWGLPLARIDLERSSRPYAFELDAGDGGKVQVQCRSRAWGLGKGRRHRLVADITALRGPLLHCGLGRGQTACGSLVLDRRATRLEGELRTAWGAVPVRSSERLEGSRLPSGFTAGYLLGDPDRPLAAVDLLNRGRVLFDPRLPMDRRADLAAAATALLLLEPELGKEG